MPADLTKPFNESCCDGGQCNTKESAQPCGCDLGADYYCFNHMWKASIQIIIDKFKNYPLQHQQLIDSLEELIG